MTPISSGTQNEIYEIRRSDLHAALRIPPPTAPPERDDGIVREFRILSALRDSDVPHAAAIAACTQREVLGRSFYLCDWLDGWSSASSTTWAEPFAGDMALRGGLAYALMDGAVSLSRFDWRASGLVDYGRPDGFHERQVERWSSVLSSCAKRALPGAHEAGDWLNTHRPIDYCPGLMHGDFQFANVVFRHGTPARLAGIVDWEMSTVGDPKLDVAWALQFWPDDTADPTIVGTHHAGELYGMPSRDVLVDYYSNASGRQMDDFDYYLILAKWKLAVVLERGYQHSNGGERFRSFGEAAMSSMASAADLAESSTYQVTR